LKSENKYWEDLVTSLEESESTPLENRNSDDYRWLVSIKEKIKQIFYWDLFDKQSAKVKLDDRL